MSALKMVDFSALDEKTRSRFWASVDKRSDQDCWEWRGVKKLRKPGSKHWYGKFWIAKVGHVYAHRAAYELMRGKIEPGLFLDHLCRNTTCVNPMHLEQVTNQINALRGVGPTAENAVKTHCPKGHELAGENLDPTAAKKGWRLCKRCRQISKKLHNDTRREKRRAAKMQGLRP